MKRLLLAASLLLSGLALQIHPVQAQASDAPCHLVIFEGHVAAEGNCPADTHTAVYKYKPGVPAGAPFEETLPQNFFDTSELPPCGPWQADVFTGERLLLIDAGHQYKDRLLDFEQGDSGVCVEASSTTTSSSTTTTSTTLATTTTAELPSSTTAPQLANTGSDHADNLSVLTLGLVIMGLGLLGAARHRIWLFTRR